MHRAVDIAEAFLHAEEVDSGIVVADGSGYRCAAGRAAERNPLDRVMAIIDRDGAQQVPVPQRIAAAEALGQAGDSRLDFTRVDYWVTILAGKFQMGSQKQDPGQSNYDPDAYGDESPVHEVYLDTYCIARYPVTVHQFQRFVEHEGYDERRWWTAGGFGQFETPEAWDEQLQHPSRPVVGVSWYEAAAFCAWATPVLQKPVSLPTEAQWERAARGTAGRKYPWGNAPPDAELLNYSSNVGHPTPVGIYPLGNTPEEISDLAGNVWEWCWDWRESYTAAPVSNPRGPDGAPDRVSAVAVGRATRCAAHRRPGLGTGRGTASSSWVFAWSQFRPVRGRSIKNKKQAQRSLSRRLMGVVRSRTPIKPE